MKLKDLQPALPFLVLPFLASAGLAQMTGTSRPDDLNDSVPAQTEHYVKPSHAGDGVSSAAPVVQAPPAYVDSYPATGPAPVLIPRQAAPETSGGLPPTAVTSDFGSATVIVRQPARPAYTTVADNGSQVTEDVTSGVVVNVPMQPHELIEGTLLKARLLQTIKTQNTAVGARFSAELLRDVGHHGEVMLPAGAVIHGRVAAIHGGKRIGGPASIRLQPQTVTLPDGASYPLMADVVEVDGIDDTHVNSEGRIQPRSHTKENVAAVGLSTVTAMAAGAVIGGGVGAAVGAAAGAGVATVVWLKQDHQEILPAGTTVTFSLGQSLIVDPR